MAKPAAYEPMTLGDMRQFGMSRLSVSCHGPYCWHNNGRARGIAPAGSPDRRGKAKMFLRLTDVGTGEPVLVNMDHVTRITGSHPGGSYLYLDASKTSLEVRESLQAIQGVLRVEKP
jgi:hypothetical protein